MRIFDRPQTSLVVHRSDAILPPYNNIPYLFKFVSRLVSITTDIDIIIPKSINRRITMKSLATALLALAHGSEANEFSTSDLNRMVESGMIDKQRLLRNAIPVSRKTSNNQYNAYSASNGYDGGDVSWRSPLLHCSIRF
jgi:hypothetical protein